MSHRLTATAILLTHNRNINISLLFIVSMTLLLIMRNFSLETIIALFGVFITFWYWLFKKNIGQETSILTIFVWYLISFYIQQKFASHALSILISYLMIIFLTLQQQEIINLRNFIIAQALAIGILELFLVMLFWPINFASRAMVLTIITFYGWDIANRQSSERKGLLAFYISLLIILLIVWSADWFVY